MAIPRNLANIAPHVAGDSGGVTGIDFSGGSTLDDYEEGTFTPAIEGSITNPSISYLAGNPSGIYRKIGQLVHVEMEFGLSSISGGSGDFRIAGLPFTITSSGASESTGQIWFNQFMTTTSYGDCLAGVTNTTYAVWSITPAADLKRTSLVQVTDTYGSVTRRLRGSLTYIASA